ncbi:MAG: hypothetical protein AB1631_16150 [Acidobacteriota bacterium]
MSPEAKSTLRSSFLLFLLFLLSAVWVRAEKEKWESIGPFSGWVYVIAIDPSHPEIMYAGTDGAGVFKTTDGGATWFTSSAGLAVHDRTEVHAIEIDPTETNIIFAGTGDGIFRSTNGGASWARIPNTSYSTVNAIRIDPSNCKIIYAGGTTSFKGEMLSKSTDRGTTWSAIKTERVVSGQALPSVSSIAIDPSKPNIIYASVNYTERKGDLIKSTNGGASWADAAGGLSFFYIREIALDPSNPGTVYVAAGNGLFKSADGGAKWIGINLGLPTADASAIAIDPSNTNTLFAGIFRNGIFKSTDGGASWIASNTGLAGSWIGSIALHPSNKDVLYAGTSRGVFASRNQGASWNSLSAGIHNAHIRTLAIDPKNTNILYASGYTAFKSTSGGASWNILSANSISSFAINPSNPNVVYAATYDGMFKSLDGGVNWIETSSGLPCFFAYSVALDPSNHTTIFAGISDHGVHKSPRQGVFKSTNGGASWAAIKNGFEDYAARVLAIDPSDAKVVYAGGGSSLFKTTNGGASWVKINYGSDRGHVQAIAINPSSSKIVFVGSEVGLFRTTNGGADWTPVHITPRERGVMSLAIDPSMSNVIYAATYDTVYMSMDGGEVWKRVNEGLPAIRVTALAIDPTDPSIVYAGTGGASVFRRRFKMLLISAAFFSPSKGLKISGRNFGKSPRVLINDTDRTALLVSASGEAIRIRGNPKALGLKPGENTLQVIGSDGSVSNVFFLKLPVR